jgi:Putative heavy-metal-binding
MADDGKQILMSTTDVVPGTAHRPVKASRMAWVSSTKSILDAHDQLEDWARRHGCDAVVGIRIVATSGVRVVEWVVYGTAITWES